MFPICLGFISLLGTDHLPQHIGTTFAMECGCEEELVAVLWRRSLERFPRHKQTRRQRRPQCYASTGQDCSTIRLPETIPRKIAFTKDVLAESRETSVMITAKQQGYKDHKHKRRTRPEKFTYLGNVVPASTTHLFVMNGRFRE
jgi:hypothetical protein